MPRATVPERGMAFWFAVRAGAIAFLVTAVASLVVPVSIELFGGGLALSTVLELGWFYELAFHRVAIDASGTGGASGRFAVALLTGTGVVLWVLYRAGRAAAAHAGPSLRDRLLTGGLVGLVYACPIAAITAVVRMSSATGGVVFFETSRYQGVVWQAFAFPALLGIGAGAAGGAVGWLPRGSRIRASLVGGWRALLGALGLAAIGVLVVAAVRPQGTAAYARVVSSNGPRVAALALGHHALLLPNQSFFVLAPSMGGCVELAGSARAISLLCPGRLPALEPPTLLDDIARIGGSDATTSATRPMPPSYWLFLLVPAIATFAAGRHAAGSAPAGSGPRGALVRGVGSGVVFALLVGAGTWMASLSLVVRSADGATATSLTLGPRPVPTALLALAWGVVGGALGAVTRRQDEGTPVPVEPEEPVPPSPTSV